MGVEISKKKRVERCSGDQDFPNRPHIETPDMYFPIQSDESMFHLHLWFSSREESASSSLMKCFDAILQRLYKPMAVTHGFKYKSIVILHMSWESPSRSLFSTQRTDLLTANVCINSEHKWVFLHIQHLFDYFKPLNLFTNIPSW